MHTPYAGINLFRFKGTFSAWPANITAEQPAMKQDADTPGAFFINQRVLIQKQSREEFLLPTTKTIRIFPNKTVFYVILNRLKPIYLPTELEDEI